MANNIQAVRGMNDILPDKIKYWQRVEKVFNELLSLYGYQEIRFPLVEKTELFKRTIGEVTDIVGKEMYTFLDRDGESLSLRPEGTASCVRAGNEHGILYNQIQRLWYSGPMFRHERPQKGRYRQFYQYGVEVFGLPGPDIDAELIFLTARLWRELGLQDQLVLQINSLGSAEARARYRDEFVKYCEQYIDQLDEDSRRRLTTNPLRILDSKNPEVQKIVSKAPCLHDFLDEESKNHFEQLLHYLNDAKIPYEINPYLVRGLDYYGRTVFEWVTSQLGAQNTVCAGGRYDGLVEQLGGKATPAVGFAFGLERLVELLELQTENKLPMINTQIYVVLLGDAAQQKGVVLAEKIRDGLPTLRIMTNCAGGNMKNQMKRADKSGASYALILGDEEINRDVVILKNLRVESPQEEIKMAELLAKLKEKFFPSPLVGEGVTQ